MLSSTPPQVPPQTLSLQPPPSSLVGQRTRINLGEIKSKIAKRIGPERTRKYFAHLQGFISSKLSKTMFDKLCFIILGHENIGLHNHLIRSIIHNACQASGPPTVNAPKSIGITNNSTHVLISLAPVYESGDVPHQLVKYHHQRSIKEDAFKQQPSSDYDEYVSVENNVPHLTGLKRLSHQHSELVEPLAKRFHVEKASSCVYDSPRTNDLVGVVDRENLEHIARHAQDPVTAPLGIPFCSARIGSSRKSLMFASSTGSDDSVGCYELGQLCDSSSLRLRMQKIAEAEGLGGVSLECANLLNNGIDIFLKQLIESCDELAKARAQNDRRNHMVVQQQYNQRLINDVQLQGLVYCKNSSITCPRISSVSLQDLKAVSELNPQLVGVNISLIREKIYLYD